MTAKEATAAALRSAPLYPLRLVRRAMRTLTWRQLGFAVALGAGLGSVSGISSVLFAYDHVWENLSAGVFGTTVLAVLLLPSLALAACVTPVTMPAWVPFVAAGAIATTIAFVLVFVIFIPWLFGPHTAVTFRSAWAEIPPFMMTGLFAALGYMHWLETTRRANALRNLQFEHVRFARQAYEARLVALQARVEPRFLFETLSDVEMLYERDAALGAHVLDNLIVHLRSALPALEETSSSLAVELELIRTWLDIMRARSGDRLLFAIPEPEAPLDARLPPMVLLPLVQHAAEESHDATRAILVSATTAGERIRVTIIGPPASFAPFSHSPALAQVRERLDAIYGDLATLTLQPALHDRSQALLEVPYERTDRRPR